MSATPQDIPPSQHDAGGPEAADDLTLALTTVVDQAVRALADAGEPVLASRLAARGWSALRTDHPELAERLNRAMHYLARREAALGK